MKKLPTISIGLSAYNEEKNIAALLRELLSQKRTTWRLKEILVYTDACSDNTVREAKSVRSPFIRVHEGKSRKGKVGRVNQMIHDCIGDALVLFDADLKLGNSHVIDSLAKTLFSSRDIQLVGGNTKPYAPTSFFERAVYSTFLVFERSRKMMKNGHNIFGCNGGCLALKTEFARTITIPNVINEDDYIYFTCMKRGYAFRHVPEAIVFYKLPKTLKDYLSQTFRSNPEAVTLNFSQYFGGIVAKEYHRPILFLVQSIWQSLLMYPVETAYIIMINILAKPFFPLISSRYKLEWYTAASTK